MKYEEREHSGEPLPETPQSWSETPAIPTRPERAARRPSPWLWVGLAAGAFGMCVLCGGALAVLGILGALSSENSSARASMGAYTAQGEPNALAMPDMLGSESSGGAGFPTLPDSGAASEPAMGGYPSLGDRESSLSDSIRDQAAERSWWSEEWSRALGDNYPEPTHVDPDGNPGWIDHNGAFHDYNSGMSDYESSTLSGSSGE